MRSGGDGGRGRGSSGGVVDLGLWASFSNEYLIKARPVSVGTHLKLGT
jgi:hypothetical protein